MNSEADAKEVVFERWRQTERKCYFLMSASGACIGYALVTVEPLKSVEMTLYFSLVLAFWAISILSGLHALHNVRKEVEAVHRSLDVPTVGSNLKNVRDHLVPSWVNERNKIYGKQMLAEEMQLLFLLSGGLLFGIERIGWIEIFRSMNGVQ
ncbi:hypothetical protein [Roseovarius mucosus]|uniref:hypothetical protein n=1 Tax=Roseovarius mucosus TaxID=215743 RepID=UPI003BADA8CF